MTLADFVDYCLAKPHAEETQPFGPNVLVYKVCGRIFALTSDDDVPTQVNLKCDPDRALDLRDEYDAIIPGYHMNKKHWNTVILDETISGTFAGELIDHSYDLVVQGLTKREKKAKGL